MKLPLIGVSAFSALTILLVSACVGGGGDDDGTPAANGTPTDPGETPAPIAAAPL